MLTAIAAGVELHEVAQTVNKLPPEPLQLIGSSLHAAEDDCLFVEIL